MDKFPASKGYVVEGEQQRLKRNMNPSRVYQDGEERFIALRGRLVDAYNKGNTEKMKRILGRINYLIVEHDRKI